MPAEEGVSEEIVVVVSGGEPPDSRAALAAPLGAPVVAADKGLEHALALGLEVTVAVGDFDSASPEAVAVAEAAGTRVERYPHEKDATDLELALDVAAAMSPERILVLAGDGGRLDHQLAALLLLGSDRYARSQVDALVGPARVHVIRGVRSFDGAPGELVTLLALHGPAEGVTTDGLTYPLRGETLAAGSSRGVSNVFATRTARVSVERGVLLAIVPGDIG
jgi:thiamine pyrophosphokinase